MIKLEGTVINVFKAPEGKTQAGEVYGGEYKLQLQGLNVLRNGQKRMELLTLTTKNPKEFEGKVGQDVSLNAGVFVVGRNLQFYLNE